MSEERRLILQMLHEQRMSVEEAERLLNALGGVREQAPKQQKPHQDVSADKQNPRIDQMMGQLGSFMEQMGQQAINHAKDKNISKQFGAFMEEMGQQWGPGLEKRFETWFNQRKSSAPSSPSTEAESSEAENLPIPEECRSIVCHHPWGNLQIEGYEGKTLQVIVEKHLTQAHAKLHLDDLRLVTRQSGDSLHLVLEGADSLKEMDNSRLDLRLKVPMRYYLDFQTEKHALSLQQFSHSEGRLKLMSQSGSINVRQVALKHIDLQTQSGGIHVEQNSEWLGARSQSGRITLKGSVFAAELRNQSGDIEIEAAIHQRCELETMSGNISAHISDGNGHLVLKTQSGDIALKGELRAPTQLKSASGDLQGDVIFWAPTEWETQSGDIDLILRSGNVLELDAESRQGEVTCRHHLLASQQEKQRVRGRMGEEGPLVRLRTTTGDILIS